MANANDPLHSIPIPDALAATAAAPTYFESVVIPNRDPCKEETIINSFDVS